MVSSTRVAALLAGVVATVALTGVADAATYRVAGKQVAVNVDASGAGQYKMRGGLRGKWTINELNEVPSTSPYYEAQGTELFKGCIDRRRDRSCKGDPSGTLSFTIRYWALYGSADPDSLIWGSCWHPVVEGTGDFADAEGVMTMVDSPTKRGVRTDYIGTLTLAGTGAASSARAVKTRAGASAATQPGC
jgi:hypothetical protein